MSGKPYEFVFAQLPSVQKSSIKPPISEWLQGFEGLSNWDPEFDKFIEIMKAAIESFLPWLLRACGSFSTLVGKWSVGVRWATLAEMVELGVDSQWAINAIRLSAPADRGILAELGRHWPSSYVTSGDPLGLAGLHEPKTHAFVEEWFRNMGQAATSELALRDYQRLQKWLWLLARLPLRPK
jgi:hypothetical protein